MGGNDLVDLGNNGSKQRRSAQKEKDTEYLREYGQLSERYAALEIKEAKEVITRSASVVAKMSPAIQSQHHLNRDYKEPGFEVSSFQTLTITNSRERREHIIEADELNRSRKHRSQHSSLKKN